MVKKIENHYNLLTFFVSFIIVLQIFPVNLFIFIKEFMIMFSDFTQHTTWIYRQLYTGLSYDLLQKFYHGISAAAYFCRTACKTDLPDIIYQS